MNPTDQIEVIKNSIGSLHHNVRCAYVNGMALRNLHKEREATVLSLLGQHSGPDALHIPNSTSYTVGIMRAEASTELATIKLLLDLSENSEAFKEAHGIIAPQLEEIARLEAEHAAAVDLKGRKLAALREAEETALAKAQAAALESPEVVKARKALAELDAPAPSKPKRQPADSIGEVS